MARTYDYTVGIRVVTSIDGMTADFCPYPWDVFTKISVRIVNEVAHVNRIVYDITSKPPATVWSGNNKQPSINPYIIGFIESGFALSHFFYHTLFFTPLVN